MTGWDFPEDQSARDINQARSGNVIARRVGLRLTMIIE
jgi:hypothetical protein